MQSGYHTAKVEWIKDNPIPEDQLGTWKKLFPFNLLENKYKHSSFIIGIQIQFSEKVSTLFNSLGMSASKEFSYCHKYLRESVGIY